jgi:hypothetical protein
MTTKELLYELKMLRRKDGAQQVFGASTHRYKLHSALSERELAAFEQKHDINLPPDYRDFLRHGGDGGAGPAYGLFRLGDWAQDAGPVTNTYLCTPFPHNEAWCIFLSKVTQ